MRVIADIRRSRRRVAAAIAALVVLAACTSPGETADRPAPTERPLTGQTAAALQPDDRVDLTVYFRTGEGPQTHLTPVVREVPVTEDLPRRALDILLAGPGPDDPDGLAPVLPATTRVRSFSVDGGVATVDVSAAVVTDARTIGASATHEALALGALANTLTEFPTIERVRLLVEGATTGRVGSVDVGAFWGAWGLPEVLVRDESIIGMSAENEGVVDVARFTTDEQTTGAADAREVQVTSVRIRDRVTHLRVVVEIADPENESVTVPAPPARVRVRDRELVLEVSDVVSYTGDLGPGQLLQVLDPGFGGARVQVGPLPGPVRVVLTPTTPRPYWLHTLASPTRIVLDVMKAPAASGDAPAPAPSPEANED